MGRTRKRHERVVIGESLRKGVVRVQWLKSLVHCRHDITLTEADDASYELIETSPKEEMT